MATERIKKEVGINGQDIQMEYDDGRRLFLVGPKWDKPSAYRALPDANLAFTIQTYTRYPINKEFKQWLETETKRNPSRAFNSEERRAFYVLECIEKRMEGLRPVFHGSKLSVVQWVPAEKSDVSGYKEYCEWRDNLLTNGPKEGRPVSVVRCFDELLTRYAKTIEGGEQSLSHKKMRQFIVALGENVNLQHAIRLQIIAKWAALDLSNPLVVSFVEISNPFLDLPTNLVDEPESPLNEIIYGALLYGEHVSPMVAAAKDLVKQKNTTNEIELRKNQIQQDLYQAKKRESNLDHPFISRGEYKKAIDADPILASLRAQRDERDRLRRIACKGAYLESKYDNPLPWAGVFELYCESFFKLKDPAVELIEDAARYMGCHIPDDFNLRARHTEQTAIPEDGLLHDEPAR